MRTHHCECATRRRRFLAASWLACVALLIPHATAQAQTGIWFSPFGAPAVTEVPQRMPPQARGTRADHLKRQLVDYRGAEPAGTIIIDTANTYLFYTLGTGRAVRYGIGVGRQGFTWSGVTTVSNKAEWPDWIPPEDMLRRQPYLPRVMAGGPGNPLGARAIYLGSTLYRIHGTNDPTSIGKHVSSGCIRLTNEDIVDLYSRVQVGAKVIVLAASPPTS